MQRLGIIGAENSHTAAIAKEVNVNQAIKGFQVTHVWGETAKFAKAAAAAGAIPTIVKKSAAMLGEVDCVMVDHRHGKHHLKAVTPYVKAGIPVFVDKPLSTSLAEAKRFLKLRRQQNVPVTTMSAVPHQASSQAVKKQLTKTIGTLRNLHLTGPGDPKSKHGGVFFYGIHQVDLMVELLGLDAKDVTTLMNGSAFSCIVRYPNAVTATISMPGVNGFSVAAIGSDGGFHAPITFDENIYRTTTKIFTRMFRTGKEPFSDARMLAPVAILEAIEKSLKTGKRTKVASLAVKY